MSEDNRFLIEDPQWAMDFAPNGNAQKNKEEV